jgi:hypothetical protein
MTGQQDSSLLLLILQLLLSLQLLLLLPGRDIGSIGAAVGCLGDVWCRCISSSSSSFS